MSWDSPSWTDLILVIFGYLLLAPRNHAQRIIYAIFSVIAYFYDPTEPMIRMIIGTYDTVLKYRIHELVAQHFRTVLTLSAIVWYVPPLQSSGPSPPVPCSTYLPASPTPSAPVLVHPPKRLS